MRTNQLIPLLAARLVPQDRHAVLWRFAVALTGGSLIAIAGLVFSLGIRADLASLIGTGIFWVKLAFPLLMACAAVMVAARLAIPGAWQGGRAWLIVTVPYSFVWVVALAVLASAPADSRSTLLLGHTWSSWPIYIAMLSLPSYLSLSWAMRGLAPTRLRLSGATVGLLSGAVGTAAYVIRCPEMNIPFWAVWYTVGMAIPTLAGWMLGRISLNWA